MLVFAFGSNLDKAQMLRRCPQSEPFAAATLRGYRLAFAGWSSRWDGSVATIERRKGARTLGALYKLTPRDVVALDGFEGSMYRRIEIDVAVEGATCRAHAYVMRGGIVGPPSLAYGRAIARGYLAWGLDLRSLGAAIRRSTLAQPPAHAQRLAV